MEKRRLLFFAFLVIFLANINAQTNSNRVTGKVTDERGEPLIGVTVVVKGSTSGVITDVNGNYSLDVSGSEAVLYFSFIGMETQEVRVGSQSQIDVVLVSTWANLEEIIVVGYGVQRKSDVISSVVSVKPESVTKVPSTDVGEMLRGKATGVYVTVDNAGPGSSSNILIRGKNSLNAGNAPIVIADGVPIGGINDINPADIASLEVLKDAAAQAIYGARASNGVILITTKRAQSGVTKVEYSGYYGAQTVRRNFDVYSPLEFAQLKREAMRTDNNNQYRPDEIVFTEIEREVLASGEFIDWEKELLRIAATQNHNLSVSTGTEKTRIYTGFNYQNRDGVIPGTDFQRSTIRINIDQSINDWIKLGANTSWQLSQNNNPGTGGTLQRSITTSPLGKIYNEDGTYRINPTGVQESFNPLLDLAEVTNTRHDRNDIMNIFIDFSPIRNFNYRINASRRSWNRKTHNYSSSKSLQGYRLGGLGQGSIRFEDNVEMQLENIVTYNLELSEHKLGFTFVQSTTEAKYNSFINNANLFPNDMLGIHGIESAEIIRPGISANRRGLISFVGRIQYDYAGKYYLNVSARADGSTVFGANNKWGYFPATAIGWNIYREAFIEEIPVISNLRLRASYGSVGNEAINPYQSQSSADQRDYIFGTNRRTGYVPGGSLPNPDLRWETSTTLNTALDFGFFRNRLSGTLELYNTRTTDLLMRQSLSASTGYSNRLTNLGEIENKGLEFNINGVIIDNRDFMLNTGFSVSMNRNKIISLYGELDELGKEIDDVANRWFIGQPIDVFYQYKPIGIWQIGEDIVNSHMPQAKPGDIKLLDRNGDGILDADDRVLTKRDPKWFGTFNLDLRYKSIDFSADVLTVQGVIRNNPYLYNYVDGGSLRGVFNGIKQDYWLPENPTGNWPRPTEANDPLYIWTMGLQDASFVRLQTVTIGYTFTKSVLSRVGLSNLRVYCTGHNLMTWTQFQSYSPEKNPNDYPEAVSVIGGVQLSF